MSKRQLWANDNEGAMEFVIPERFVDIRKFRQVPDHQEVFADADTDQSIIVDLNQYQNVADEKAAKYFLDDLAETNEAKNCNVLASGVFTQKEIPNMGSDWYASFVIGEQKISKFNESSAAANTVQLFLVNIRLKKYKTDILITFNVPVQFSETSSSNGKNVLDSETNKGVIQNLLESFKINSYDIFGPPNQ